MADSSFDALLQAFALQEAQKSAIANASPYAGLSSSFNDINKLILGASSNPQYGTGEKIAAGLIGGLLGGGANYLNEDWQGRAKDEYRSALLGGFGGQKGKRDLLPRSIWDTAEDQGQALRMKSIWDAKQSQQELENELKTYGLKKGVDVAADREKLLFEKPWLKDVQPGTRADSPGDSTDAIATEVPAGGANSDHQRVMEGLRRGEFNSPAEGYKFLREEAQRAADLEREAQRLEYEREQDIFGSQDNVRKEIAKIPSVSQFLTMQKSLPLVKGFKDQDTRSSDVGFVYNYVKSLDEGAVREGEISLANSSNPLIQQYAKQLQGAFSGQSQLTPKLKNQMYSELIEAQSTVYAQAKKDADVLAQIAKSRGITDNIYPFDTGLDFTTKPTQSNFEMNLMRSFQTGGAPAASKELIREYYSKHGDTPETRAMIKEAWPKVRQMLEGAAGGS